MTDKGLLATEEHATEPSFPAPKPHTSPLAFTASQQAAINALEQKVKAGTYSTTLVDGVTGSGKTEVYFEAINEALKSPGQVLILLPEIALSSQWLTRFEARFGVRPASWHSDLTSAQRRDTWRAVALGNARVVVGARSALFLPYPDLRMIVIDEEHDTSFKQEDGVIYQARDMAVVRGHLGQFPVILASATPSLETLQNVEQGKYDCLHLPARATGADMPDVATIDMRQQNTGTGNQTWLSQALCEGITKRLEAGEQVLLYLNRRGYAPLVLCRSCGHRFECPQCTAWMVQHKSAAGLLCHQCGYRMAAPETCPSCHQSESLVPCGPGVERIHEEVVRTFPEARSLILSSDTLTSAGVAQELISRIQNHDVDILIGTQIIAKGYHFPLLTLVGVIDADLGLSGSDLRASEQTFQLLHQVSGRAGREDKPGEVLLQTYMPGHPVIQALLNQDRDAFLGEEMDLRRATGMPPFGKLAAFVIASPDEKAAQAYANRLARQAPAYENCQIFGPAPAPFARLRGKFRFRLLLKTPNNVDIQELVRGWIADIPAPSGVRLYVDIDPYSFF